MTAQRYNKGTVISLPTICEPPNITREEIELLRFIKWNMIRKLPTDRQKLVFVMLHLLEMPQQDIAFCLDVHKSEITRQKTKIKRSLDEFREGYR